LRIRLLFFGIGVSVVFFLIAIGVGAYGFWQASQTASSTREALCQLLVNSRRASLRVATSADQAERIVTFYNEQVALVEGCRIR
jgi:hypothetical protein